MPLDYDKIRTINKGLYGSEVANYGKLFFEDMYADRTHFIFEMLQNAEDAIARRGEGWTGPRHVSFLLDSGQLRVEHFGDPFNEDDVKGICSINRSTKKESLTEIGRFGIGFKSVYAFTARPEIHSGGEHFAIEHYVWPFGIHFTGDEDPQVTRFVLPFRDDVPTTFSGIEKGFRRLGADTLLFLRHIEEIKWASNSGKNGHYLRESKRLDEGVQHIIVVAEEDGNENIHSEWLLFSEQIRDENRAPAGQVDIAFPLEPNSGRIDVEENSRLSVFFPTHLETHFGLKLNGPYRTTTNRENVPHHDSWNKHLVGETAALLQKGLRWLRDRNRLDTATLRCLPISAFSLGWMHDGDNLFDPLYNRTREALSAESLLPRLGGGYTSADKALLGRTAGIRALLTAEQIAAIYGNDEMSWLSDEISQDPILTRYLVTHLDVEEVRPENIIRRLSQSFLEEQSADWIEKLYEFLLGQGALAQLYRNTPLVRLESGYHVRATINGHPQAYLPTENTTGFPTVAASVCTSPEAKGFLKSLGLKEPDLVDDVLQNILPKYNGHDIDVNEPEYDEDVRRIVTAFETSAGQQKIRLLVGLDNANFVKLTDAAGSSTPTWGSPEQAYLPTESLRELFEGVSGVRFVDTSIGCLNDENTLEMLKACGTASRLSAVKFENETRFERSELRRMRFNTQRDYGSTRQEEVLDVTIRGLSMLLSHLPRIDVTVRARRAELLWEALREISSSEFSGRYTWFYYSSKSLRFDAEFVEELRHTPWIPSGDGTLECPEFVNFNDLGWEEDSFLQSKMPFKPSTLVVLAEEAGVELGVLDELKKRGIATIADLREAIGDFGTDELAIPVAELRDTQGNVVDVAEEGSFDRALREAMTPNPSDGPINMALIPPGGPNTDEAAVADTQQSAREGRDGYRVTQEVSRFALTEPARELEENFKSMLQGDYGKRCQICGTSFLTRSGEFQIFADHIVSPARDSHTNHFGNLLSLCGWHYALISHGQWVLLDSKSGNPIAGPEGDVLLGGLLEAPEKYDDDANQYRSIPIRFWNVYPEWRPQPETIDEEIRFSVPHWKYLCELLKT